MPEPQILVTGLAFPESPRWHEDRLWCADWGAQQLIAVDLAGKSEVVLNIPSFPFSFDWLPDGRLLIVSAAERKLLRQEADGSLVDPRRPERAFRVPLERDRRRWPGQRLRQQHRLRFSRWGIRPRHRRPGHPRRRGAAGRGRRRLPQRHGCHARQRHPDRRRVLRQPADGLRHRRRRQPVRPAGVGRRSTASPTASASMRRARSGTRTSPTSAACACAKAARCCRRSTLDRGCFACMLGGADGRTLFLAANTGAARRAWPTEAPMGQILTAPAPAPRAGWP